MALAAAFRAAPQAVDGWLRSPGTVALAVVLTVAGFGLSLFLIGNAVAFVMIGCGAFVLFGVALARPLLATRVGSASLLWVSRHSLSLFLTHQLTILLLVPDVPVFNQGMWLRTGLALVLAVVAALMLEAAVRITGFLLGAARARWGVRGSLLRFGLPIAGLYAVLLAGEVISRQVAPGEIAGWGERPALMPDAKFGWRLIPSQTTRLRWETYDYLVEANPLGFPGPAYPPAKSEGALRVLTTGDAFTSAEGVDTDRAWPRLLEEQLATRLAGRPVEVMNFAITGYGPNQYAAIVADFVPRYRPDVILVQFFVNDFEDAVTDVKKFRRGIGFGRPDPDGLFATLTLGNLYKVTSIWLRRLVMERVLGRPDPKGAFFAMLPMFNATGSAIINAESIAAVERSVEEIATIAKANNATLIALLVPAGIQVCSPEDLPYFPHGVDLGDASRYDLDRPQRTLAHVINAFGVEAHDLRPVLRTAGERCPYQPHNLHWRESGHTAVSSFVADLIADHATTISHR
ncbi:MAG: SGNH/GDSL hydrolase family protein [Rhodospirillales bacterium]|nr:SGNH/GDSL hydrolase family protein [Rhodospirillales bacterium]